MYKVYWTGKSSPGNNDGVAESETYESLDMALKQAAFLRERGYTFVTMCSENPNSVGKPGVDSVKDGVLPDGEPYTWMMRRTQ